MKYLSKKLAENGQGDYTSPIWLTWKEAKYLNKLLRKEINREKTFKNDKGKEVKEILQHSYNWQMLKNVIPRLTDTYKYLGEVTNKREEGRYLAAKKKRKPLK